MDFDVYVGNGNDFYVQMDRKPYCIRISKTLDEKKVKEAMNEICKILEKNNYKFVVKQPRSITPIVCEYNIVFE